MDDFSKLDSETRAFALIGQFLHSWAAMETALHECIQSTFKLTPVMTNILCANIQMRDKLNILKTAVHVANAETIKNIKLLRKIGNHAAVRNTVAHDAFKADPAGRGVQFSVIKAKGPYSETPVVWSAKRFKHQ